MGILLVILLLYLFVSRLSKLVLMQRFHSFQRKTSVQSSPSTPSDTSPSTEVYNVQKMTLSATQNRLIYVITRTIVLSAVALMTTHLFSVYAFFYVSFGKNGLFILYILWTVDMTTNSICIYLNFKHSKTSYDRYCKFCHGCIQKMIARYSTKKIMGINEINLAKCQTSSKLDASNHS